jgi:hypothetical protein
LTKKNQKTFAVMARVAGESAIAWQEFLLLFAKRSAFLLFEECRQ